MAVVNSDDDSDDECVSARSDTEAKEDQGGETSCEDLGEDYEPPEGVKCMCEAPATSENIIATFGPKSIDKFNSCPGMGQSVDEAHK